VWQASIAKPNAFYEQHATDKPKKFFYHIDIQGRVFLEETLPKNIATSLKNPGFLDFFLSNLKICSARDHQLLPPRVRDEYPYVSLCGIERNFVRPADSPIVFVSIDMDESSNFQLHFGASLRQIFDPSCLAISRRTGRLYHQLVGDVTRLHKETGGYGLIKSSVAVTLSDRMVTGNAEDDSGMYFDFNGVLYSIPCLPDSAEPGVWAMPYCEE
jgi:hypothetical protein